MVQQRRMMDTAGRIRQAEVLRPTMPMRCLSFIYNSKRAFPMPDVAPIMRMFMVIIMYMTIACGSYWAMSSPAT